MNNFAREVKERVATYPHDENLQAAAAAFMVSSTGPKYSYNFSWLGRPIIQYPQDILAMQEIIWEIKPDLIIETGIAHGGSLICWASLLELNAACGGPSDAEVLGIDIDIREHNRRAIEDHPLFARITMLEGSSVDRAIVDEVTQKTAQKETVLVVLDSNHTHDHVLAELEYYAPLTSPGSYCVVFDTIIKHLPDNTYPDRPWSREDNPATAVEKYLRNHREFEVDTSIDDKLLISVAPGGYLKRLR